MDKNSIIGLILIVFSFALCVGSSFYFIQLRRLYDYNVIFVTTVVIILPIVVAVVGLLFVSK
jgi:hypothetical protein